MTVFAAGLFTIIVVGCTLAAINDHLEEAWRNRKETNMR